MRQNPLRGKKGELSDQIIIERDDFSWDRVNLANFGGHMGVSGIDLRNPGFSERQLGSCEMKVLGDKNHGPQALCIGHTFEVQCRSPSGVPCFIQKYVARRNAQTLEISGHNLRLGIPFFTNAAAYDNLRAKTITVKLIATIKPSFEAAGECAVWLNLASKDQNGICGIQPILTPIKDEICRLDEK